VEKAVRLAASLERSVQAFVLAECQDLGSIEWELESQSQELFRAAAEKAAQQKADATPPACPFCQQKLRRVSAGHARTVKTRFGMVTIPRVRGYCQRCKKWRFPADAVMGLEETGSSSPRLQEMAALLASKMPVEEASQVLEHPPICVEIEMRPHFTAVRAFRFAISLGSVYQCQSAIREGPVHA